MARCETVLYRGKVVCKHSVHKYEAVANQSGSAFYLKPIQGSYNTSVSASQGTHAGGGAEDHEYDNYTWSIAWIISKLYRKNMLLEWIRWWTGNHHGHSLDPECPNLSPEAVAQFVEFGKGGDGLVGDLKDPGDRTYASQIMALFNGRRTIKARVKLIQRGLGVTVDGVWGSQTDAAIKDVLAAKTTGVRAVQTGLLVDADGVWGSVTDAAYVKLRAAAYVAPTTTTTPVAKPSAPQPNTWDDDSSLPYGDFPYPNRSGSVYGPSTTGKNYWSGKAASSTMSVEKIQTYIKKIQKRVGSTVDGRFGTETFNDVKRYQKAHGLYVDGLVGPATWRRMTYPN